VSGGQRHAGAQLGGRGNNLGITIRAAAVRLCIPAQQGTLRPGAAIPLRRRDEILTPPAGSLEFHRAASRSPTGRALRLQRLRIRSAPPAAGGSRTLTS